MSLNIPPHAASYMHVELEAIQHNYRRLQAISAQDCGAVLKANAYGVGMQQVGVALSQAGCQHFFVATIEEGTTLRHLLPKAFIYVLNGVYKGAEEFMRAHQLTPVLNDQAQIEVWETYAKRYECQLPAILHVDTGMWRLGLPFPEAAHVAARLSHSPFIKLTYVMSHLASSDRPKDPKNGKQLERFQQVIALFPGVPASFANSHAIFLHKKFHYDLTRPGRSLYGLGPDDHNPRQFRPAISVYGRVLQIANIPPGETIGYNSTYTVKKPMRVATLAFGYADGMMRSLSNCGHVYFADYAAAIVGRISMDLITVDVTDVPEHIAFNGTWAEIIGPHQSADTLASAAGTISRELLANLGHRYCRVYS